MMKKMLMMAAVAAFAFVAGAAMPRSEWSGKVGACAKNPALLKATIGQLSMADQKAFIAEVNKAIMAMPGSVDQKAAAFYLANKAAVTGATKEARLAVLAEVFATVPVESLPVITEKFSVELFGKVRSHNTPDVVYKRVCKKVLSWINPRVEPVANTDVREAFAVMMLARAKGGTQIDPFDELLAEMPNETARAEAKSSWIPQATATDGTASYDAILGAAGAGAEPNMQHVNEIIAGESAGTGSTMNDGIVMQEIVASLIASGDLPANTQTTIAQTGDTDTGAATETAASTTTSPDGGKIATTADFQGGIFSPTASGPAGSVNVGRETIATQQTGADGGTGFMSTDVAGGQTITVPTDIVNPDWKRGDPPPENWKSVDPEPKPYSGQ